MEPNEAMKAMAKLIAARRWPKDSAEYIIARDAALAAIMETQRLDAELADQLAQSTQIVGGLQDWSLSFDERQICTEFATAIRTGEHYALAGNRHG